MDNQIQFLWDKLIVHIVDEMCLTAIYVSLILGTARIVSTLSASFILKFSIKESKNVS